MIDLTIRDMIDDAASALADANVETCWYLRGILDGLCGEKHPPDEYKNEYNCGFRHADEFMNS